MKLFSIQVVTMMLLVAQSAIADDKDAKLESSKVRTYGKMYVAPIAVGSRPPVYVSQHVCGPELETSYNAMRDPARPSIVVFCKRLGSESDSLLVPLSASCAFAGIPLFLTVTADKGIGDGNSAHYMNESEAKELSAQIARQITRMGIDNATVGVAVNRFWQSNLGYADGHDFVVAYVRSNVLALKSLNSTKITPTEVSALLAELGRNHRGTFVQQENGE